MRTLLMILAVAVTATTGCRHAQMTKSHARRNEQPRTYSVWRAKPDLANALRRGESMDLLPGMAIARRFQSRAAGTYVRGAFYVVQATGGRLRPPGASFWNWLDPDPLAEDGPVVIISVCSDEGNHLGHISRTRLCSTSIVLPVPVATLPQNQPYYVPFAMSCKIEQGKYCWLVLEPGGLLSYLSVSVLETSSSADNLLRSSEGLWGPGYIHLVADLDIVGKTGRNGAGASAPDRG